MILRCRPRFRGLPPFLIKSRPNSCVIGATRKWRAVAHPEAVPDLFGVTRGGLSKINRTQARDVESFLQEKAG